MAEQLTADYVVIGSGIIGSLAARKLALAGASVLILEAGPRVTRGEIVARFRNSRAAATGCRRIRRSPRAPHPIYQPEGQWLPGAGRALSLSGRIHPPGRRHHLALGRASVAQCAERLPHPQPVRRGRRLADQLRRPGAVLPGSRGNHGRVGRRQYRFAAQQAVSDGAGGRTVRDAPHPRTAGDPPIKVVGNTTARNSRSYDGRPACCGNNSCQPICPIDAQYHGGIAAAAGRSGRRQDAVPTPMSTSWSTTTRAASRPRCTTIPTRRSHRVTGKTFILAANGIESPRLLLLSAQRQISRTAWPTAATWSGRNLMDHPSTSITFDADEDLWLGRGPAKPQLDQHHARRRISAASMRPTAWTSRTSRGSTAPRKQLIGQGVYGEEFEQQLRYRAAREMSLKNVLEVLPQPGQPHHA